MTPEDRATLEWAFRVVFGFSAENEVIVMRDLSIVTAHDRTMLDPSGEPQDALIVALAQVMKLRLTGVQAGKLRRDLIAAGMRKKAANRVHDHLADVSVGEWNRLKERINWYRDDTCLPITGSTMRSGDT
ncbi:hypothetical protein [Aliiroseovarius marinus]|uniref:hypothetical protein n=1 Tax=Aliiroseovarius marinus TaxID=2500159 RepID=UPI003D7EECA2